MNKIVRATAGAGKTTGLLDAVYDVYKSFLIKEGKVPKVLLSTFTVKAANELSERLITKAIELSDEGFLDYVSSSFLEVGTLHSVFLKILDKLQDDESVGEQSYFSQAQRSTVGRGLLHNLIKEESLEEFFIEGREERDVLKVFMHMYENTDLKSKVVGIEDLLIYKKEKEKELVLKIQDDYFQEIFEKTQDTSVWLSYIAELDKKEQKKFKDLKAFLNDEVNGVEFLDKYAKKHEVYAELFNKWSVELRKYIEENQISSILDAEVQVIKKLKEKGFSEKVWDFCFFDEYQDTSPMQKKVIDIVSAKSVNYFVGDPFQSIYFFRGARKEIFLNEFLDIEESGGDTEYRLNNYRSAPEIVKFANGLTKFVLPDFIEMEPAVEGVKGDVKVVHFKDGGVEDEFLHITNCLKEINLNNESVAILSRGSKELLGCGKVLRRHGVTHRFSLSKGFESSLEVIELVSFLRFLIDPDDDENLLILLMSFWCSISDLELQRAAVEIEEKGVSLWSVFSEHSGVSIIRGLRENIGSVSLSIILSDFIGSSGFLSFSESMDPTKDREHNTLKFMSALASEEQRKGFNLKGFLDDILSGSYRFESEEIKLSSGCLLMTIHGSKGLQFDHVFILGTNKSNAPKANSYYFNLEDGVFSLKENSKSDAKMRFPAAIENLVENEKLEMLSENKRLFYVAMTRAKRSLTILGSKKISKTSKAPSWLSLTLNFLSKTNQENLAEELEVLDDAKSEVEEVKRLKGFLLRTDESEFLEKKSAAVTSGDITDEEYSGDVEKFSRLSLAISEGVFFHELMERVSSLPEALDEVSNCLEVDKQRHIDAVKYLFEQENFPFCTILASGEKEWGFDYNGEKSISGKVDLWAESEGEVWIVDYKTGQTAGAEKGFSQLKVYKEMLKKYLGVSKVLKYNLVLTFPYEKKTFVELDV